MPILHRSTKRDGHQEETETGAGLGYIEIYLSRCTPQLQYHVIGKLAVRLPGRAVCVYFAQQVSQASWQCHNRSPPTSVSSACSSGSDSSSAPVSLMKSTIMFKANHENSADEEVVPIHITMNEQQVVQPAKTQLAFGQAVDAGRLSINCLQQEAHDFPAISQMAEELGCIGMHIWMMTRHFETSLSSTAQHAVDTKCVSLGQRVRRDIDVRERAVSNPRHGPPQIEKTLRPENEVVRPTDGIIVECFRRDYNMMGA